MKKIIILLLTLTAINVAGQNNLIGIKGGINWTNISLSPPSDIINCRTGLNSGLTYEYLLNTHFSLGADLIYNQRGERSVAYFTDQAGNDTGDKAIEKFNIDYISVPLKVGYQIGHKFYGFANIGVIPSMVEHATLYTPLYESYGRMFISATADMTKRVTKFDIAGLLELGGGYKFKNRYWLFTSIGYQYSFTTLYNSNYFINDNLRNHGITWSVGIKYALTK